MAEMPEYKQSNPVIEPGPVNEGIQETYNRVGNSSLAIGAVGATLAQNMANQLSTMRGEQQAIANPDRPLFPNFTESDAHFNKAFEETAYQTALTSARQMIQNQFNILSTQPINSDTVGAFGKNLMLGFSSIVNGNTLTIQNKLKGDLSQLYSSSYGIVSKQLFRKNQQHLQDNFKINVDNGLENVYSTGYSGLKDQSKIALSQTLGNIEASRRNGTISDGTSDSLKKSAELAYQYGKYNNKIANMVSKGREGQEEAAKYIADFTKNKPEHMTVDTHQHVADSMQKELHRLSRLRSDYDNLNYLDFKIKLQESSLTPSEVEKASRLLDADTFKKLMAENQHKARVEANETTAYNRISNSIRRNENLDARYGEKSIQKVFDHMVKLREGQLAAEGKPMTFLDKAMIAETFKAKKLDIVGEVEDKLLSGNADDMKEASLALKRATTLGATYLTKMSDEARLVGKVFQRRIETTKKPIEKIMEESRNRLNQTPEQKEIIEQKFKKLTNQDYTKEAKEQIYSFSNPLNQKAGIKKELSINGDIPIPNEMLAIFRDEFENAYKFYDDKELAKKEAIEQIKPLTGKSMINGEPEIWVYPIEQQVPDKTPTRVRNDFAYAVATLFDKQKELFENGEFPEYYEVQPGYLVKDYENKYTSAKKSIIKSSFRGPDSFKVNRYYTDMDGKLIKESGTIKLGSDAMTTPSKNKAPSYPVMFVPDGSAFRQQVRNPFSPGYARFRPKKLAEEEGGADYGNQSTQAPVEEQQSPVTEQPQTANETTNEPTQVNTVEDEAVKFIQNMEKEKRSKSKKKKDKDK